ASLDPQLPGKMRVSMTQDKEKAATPGKTDAAGDASGDASPAPRRTRMEWQPASSTDTGDEPNVASTDAEPGAVLPDSADLPPGDDADLDSASDTVPAPTDEPDAPDNVAEAGEAPTESPETELEAVIPEAPTPESAPADPKKIRRILPGRPSTAALDAAAFTSRTPWTVLRKLTVT